MDIVPKPTTGKQLSKRIYISIAIDAVIIIFVMMYFNRL